MKVRINREEPTAAQRRALKAECVCEKQLKEDGINLDELLKG